MNLIDTTSGILIAEIGFICLISGIILVFGTIFFHLFSSALKKAEIERANPLKSIKKEFKTHINTTTEH